MGTLIAEFGGKYLEWSTSSHAPSSSLMSLAELRRNVLDNEGFESLMKLGQSLERVDRTGSSSRFGFDKKALLAVNNAGLKGDCVSTEAEMVQLYGAEELAEALFAPTVPLDPTKPLELFDYQGIAESWHQYAPPGATAPIPVHEVLTEHRGVIFAAVTVPWDPNTMNVLIDLRNGQVLTTNFCMLRARNTEES